MRLFFPSMHAHEYQGGERWTCKHFQCDARRAKPEDLVLRIHAIARRWALLLTLAPGIMHITKKLCMIPTWTWLRLLYPDSFLEERTWNLSLSISSETTACVFLFHM